jgi:outer membrane protein
VRFIHAILVACILLVPGNASAGRLLDYIRNYDLNDYALGLAISTEQNPYVGAKNSAFAYPYLTSFRDSAFTDDWFLIRDGDVGARWVSESGWELGLVGRVQTLGLGNSETDELIGIEDRKWTLELGPTVGWRGWPVHINLTTYTEISDRHDGLISQLAFSLPYEWSRGYVVPGVELIHQSRDYVNYYYEVSSAEATPSRPAYSAGEAMNTAFKVRWGYALNDKWLLSGTIGLELLDSAITDSPIVERDNVWSARVGIAYNANLFQPREYKFSDSRQPRFEFRIGAFRDMIDSKVARDTTNGVPGFEIDIEEILGAPEEKTVLQMEAFVRLGHYHRLEFGYFELSRNASTTSNSDISFGDELFAAGVSIDSRIDAKIFRAGYAYSIMKDAQKELGVMAGLHIADFDTEIAADATGQRESSNAGTPLPVVGAHGSVALGANTSLGARIQFFRMDFDRYEGSLNYLTLELQRRFGDKLSAGIAYNYYRMNLSSNDSDVNGYLKLRHHGPVLFLSAHF